MPTTVPAPVPAPTLTGGRIARTPDGDGYWMVEPTGIVHGFGAAAAMGNAAVGANTPAVIASTQSGRGYWVMASDGAIFAFGDAQYYGAANNGVIHPGFTANALTPTPSGHGYWITTNDGAVFGFGDAQWYGATNTGVLRSDVVTDMATTPTGHGYWILSQTGGVFAFGDASSYGAANTGVLGVDQAIDLQPTPTGHGYWILSRTGGVFAFGDAAAYGAANTSTTLNGNQAAGMASTPSGQGYWIMAIDGAIFSFGDAIPVGGYNGSGSSGTPAFALAALQQARLRIGKAFSSDYSAVAPGATADNYCAAFTSWAFVAGGDPTPEKSAGVSTWVTAARNNQLGMRIVSANEARAGDLVAFDWGSDGFGGGAGSHIGIVESVTVSGGQMTVKSVDGNTTSGSQSGVVAEKTRTVYTSPHAPADYALIIRDAA